MKTASLHPKNNQPITIIKSQSIRYPRPEEIVYLQSDDCYTYVHLADASTFLLSKTLKSVEQELDPDFFFRCHRSFLINRVFVTEISRKNGDHLIMKTGVHVPISRRKLSELKSFLKQTATANLINDTVY